MSSVRRSLRVRKEPEKMEKEDSEEKFLDLHCQECDKLFKYAKAFENHMEKVHDTKTEAESLIDEDCNEYSSSIFFGEETPPDSYRVECQMCNKVFRYVKAYETHIRKVHEHLCFVAGCNDKFETRILLEKHIRKEHTKESHDSKTEDESLVDEDCNEYFSSIFSGEEAPPDSYRVECRMCNKVFKYVKAYETHIRKVHEHLCPVRGCNDKFEARILLAKHIRKEHTEESYLCQICNNGFKTEMQLEEHVREHFECNICDFWQGNNQDELRKHIIQCHILPCELCDKVFKSNKRLIEHFSGEHQVKFHFTCEICSMMFTGKRSHIQHKKDYHTNICEHCNATFQTKLNLSQHMLIKHGVEMSQVCSFCENIFSNKTSLEKHIVQDHYFECDQCDDLYTSDKLLVLHQVSHYHPNTFREAPSIRRKSLKERALIMSKSTTLINVESYEEPVSSNRKILVESNALLSPANRRRMIFEQKALKNSIISIDPAKESSPKASTKLADEFMCEVCHITYKRMNLLEKHILNFHNLKCQHCDQRFQNHALLVQHLSEKHSIPEGFSCKICDCIFTQRDKLNHHVVKNHTFRCAYCPEVYTTNDTLLEHVANNHSDMFSPRYKCDYCSETRVSKYYLDKHILNQHSSKCGYCDEVFVDEESFVEHMRLVHSIISKKIPQFSKRVKCDLCGITICATYSLRQHFETCHKDLMYEYDCAHCDATLKSKSLLENHLQIHQQTAEYKFIECYVCRRVFTYTRTLRSHFKKSHPEFEFKLEYKCIKCNELFDEKVKVRKHTRTHGVDQDSEYESEEDECENQSYDNFVGYECDDCDEVFESFHEWETHRRSHIKKMKFEESPEVMEIMVEPEIKNEIDILQCNSCDLFFESQDELEIHSKFHIKSEVC